MPVNRFYIDAPLVAGESVQLEGAEHHHAAKVVRCAEGDEVELVNGRGALATAVIKGVQRRTVELELTTVAEEAPAKQRLILVQAFPRKNRLDTIVEKTTELGADVLCLFPAATSERSACSEERVIQAMAAAMKQCGRLFLPELWIEPSLSSALKKLAEADLYYGDVATDAIPFHQQWKAPEGDAAFIIGPESGLVAAEELELKGVGAKGVALHPWILRTDTAAISVMTLMKYWTHYSLTTPS